MFYGISSEDNSVYGRFRWKTPKWINDKSERNQKYFFTKELEDAMCIIIWLTQKEPFNQSITKELKRNKVVNKKIKLKNLISFLDGDHLIIIGGRLKFANISLDVKVQVLASLWYH